MYDSRSEAIAAQVPAAIKTLQILGYYSGGDGGGALYRRLLAAPSSVKPWHFRSADGAWWDLASNREANVRRFGAVGDGVTDDTLAVLAAVEYLASTGGVLYLPAGKYLISRTIDIDLSASTSDTDGTTINVKGDGSGNTILIHAIAADVPLIRLRGGSTDAGIHIWGKWSGFTVHGQTMGSGIGIQLLLTAYALFEDITTLHLNVHWDLQDVLSCTWMRCQARWGAIGFRGRHNMYSMPNALTFVGCQASLQYQHGIQMNNGSALTWIGGSIEGNAHYSGGDVNKCAVFLNDPGYEGGVAATFVGTYFESNAGLASIRVVVATKQVTVNCQGCTFNSNVADPYVQNHIRIDQLGGFAQLNIPGCTFSSYNGYTPNTARKVVKFYGTNCGFTDTGALYTDAAERP